MFASACRANHAARATSRTTGGQGQFQHLSGTVSGLVEHALIDAFGNNTGHACERTSQGDDVARTCISQNDSDGSSRTQKIQGSEDGLLPEHPDSRQAGYKSIERVPQSTTSVTLCHQHGQDHASS